jgi:putative phosphoribosyl transferase
MRFRDRTDAGRQLAERLRDLDLVDPVVLALPRGGVPVAAELAEALDAPLEVYVARKIGAPGRPEAAIGAIAEGGGSAVDRFALQALGLSLKDFDFLVDAERRELDRRVRAYRGSRPLPPLENRDVVLVDDGVATGMTAEAALQALRSHRPRRLILAAPTCAPETAARLRMVADQVVCVITPTRFHAVGLWYDDFGQTSDEEVLELLERAATRTASAT